MCCCNDDDMNTITYRCERLHEFTVEKEFGDPVAGALPCREPIIPSCAFTAHLQGETNPSAPPIPQKFMPTDKGPYLSDVGMELGEWIGSMLPGMQFALDAISAHRWSEEDRDDVIRRVGGILVDDFEDLGQRGEPDIDTLEGYAQNALAAYVAAKARAVVKRQRQARR